MSFEHLDDKKKLYARQIVSALRQIEVLVANGKSMDQVCREAGSSYRRFSSETGSHVDIASKTCLPRIDTGGAALLNSVPEAETAIPIKDDESHRIERSFAYSLKRIRGESRFWFKVIRGPTNLMHCKDPEIREKLLKYKQRL